MNNRCHKWSTMIRIAWRAALLGLTWFVVAEVARISLRVEDFPAAALELSADSLAGGAVETETELSLPLTVVNRSTRSIQIQRFEQSHPSLRITPVPQTVPSGATARFEARVDLQRLRENEDEPAQDGRLPPFEIRLRPITDWGRAPVPWRIRALPQKSETRETSARRASEEE